MKAKAKAKKSKEKIAEAYIKKLEDDKNKKIDIPDTKSEPNKRPSRASRRRRGMI